MDFVRRWPEKTSGFYDWQERYGKVNEHDGRVPQDSRLEEWAKHPLEGCQRLRFMMLDPGIVAVSPSSVWRVLSQGELMSQWNTTAIIASPLILAIPPAPIRYMRRVSDPTGVMRPGLKKLEKWSI